MTLFGKRNPASVLNGLNTKTSKTAFYNLTRDQLVDLTLRRNQGVLGSNGALCINTGEFTGRSPMDRYIVKDASTADTVDWGSVNLPADPEIFRRLRQKMVNYFADKDLFIRDAFAGADKRYQISIRLITEHPWSNLFAYNMFLRPTEEELELFLPEWTILCAPGLRADCKTDGTRQHNFAMINFTEKEIIIGGTGYTGEIKKSVFSVMNYLLPLKNRVLPMHCSANAGKEGDVAIFFGLSGTGKTTLSSDPDRLLIGDDEHGWSDQGIFNFEGGCYAKCIDLSFEKEPLIFQAIKHGALLENTVFEKGTNMPDYADDSITQNTRVSYPLTHIKNAVSPSIAGHPKNIFFLTCDAFGVLPPISKLKPNQAEYFFLSGYTSKIAGTEEGITEPQATFSTCFGSPFLPLPAKNYGRMFSQKIEKNKVDVWLVNTGWIGGAYGDGMRIPLKYTRAMIAAVLDGSLAAQNFTNENFFGLAIPDACPNIPNTLLNPRKTWKDKSSYDQTARDLVEAFLVNFEKFRVRRIRRQLVK